jgi:hypothetical protein
MKLLVTNQKMKIVIKISADLGSQNFYSMYDLN